MIDDTEALEYARALKEYCIKQIDNNRYCVNCPLGKVGCEYDMPYYWHIPENEKEEKDGV